MKSISWKIASVIALTVCFAFADDFEDALASVDSTEAANMPATGLLDPVVIVREKDHQVSDVLNEIRAVAQNKGKIFLRKG